MASSKATLEAKKRDDYRRKQLEKKKEIERQQKVKLDYIQRGYDKMERQTLGVVRSLSEAGANANANAEFSVGAGADNRNSNGRLMLEATSVHGQGDKITLPPSLLSTLAARDLLRTSQERGQPLFFRLGIRRKGYTFPAGDKMKQLMNDYNNSSKSCSSNDEDGNRQSEDQSMATFEDDDHDDGDDQNGSVNEEEWERAYLDELSHEYISYVYATVIEFTQDEGYVGLPFCIAAALLSPDKSKVKAQVQDGVPSVMTSSIESKFTIDPASVSASANATTAAEIEQMDIDNNNNDNNNGSSNDNSSEDNLESKTPGHPAYGSFPVPVEQIEISLLTHLPLGKKCTLQPTTEAIQNGFYNLKDVKLALEQSLIRTRGCLNVGDVVHCWHRGVKFDLSVRDVSPPRVGAVSCVNTDVEVDIAATADTDTDTEGDSGDKDTGLEQGGHKLGRTISGGYRLSDNITSNVATNTSTASSNDNSQKSASSSSSSTNANKHSSNAMYNELLKKGIPPEPGIEQKENIIVVQIRGDGGKQCRRRFDSSVSTIEDIYAFVLSEEIIESNTVNEFRLVTRFPRRVFTLEEHGSAILQKMELSKQELFLIEKT
eukprot:CAMPEP_0203665036 /NCGR_PEP_ID=MMETSP0090-20130426/2320_1 /ASSEMBLY_ACC=CAM_ASM_001088 /TAXON_ID=426623 /ORGANISM="Chaetoceros affinis, Strain CCMP159" /LENGTH=601 /DNA_ID=CAMNT_0050528471 /DNA_START=136 /DNA_END=1937 /DNA_ORIENTATION=-